MVSESVTQGHPDKVIDNIHQAILDEAIRKSLPVGELPHVALEGVAKAIPDGRAKLFLAGEVTLPSGVALNYERIARNTIRRIGYTRPDAIFWHGMKDIEVFLSEQSGNIREGVKKRKNKGRTGAGDQGEMYGGAVAHEGPEYMPLAISLARALTLRYTELFKSGILDWARPDGKSQVVIRYYNGKPVGIDQVIL